MWYNLVFIADSHEDHRELYFAREGGVFAKSWGWSGKDIGHCCGKCQGKGDDVYIACY
jgi:hypothetical protein